MAFKKIILIVVTNLVFIRGYNQENLHTLINIIPIPNHYEILKGSFDLNKKVSLEYDKEFEIAANSLKEFIEKGSSIELRNSKASKLIKFHKSNDLKNNESYVLEISPDEIRIKAKSGQGAFYAVQSLRQILPVEFENGTYKKKKVKIPCLRIEDNPQFSYRGMHLDVGRHMFSVDFIKKYIDALAMLKMNTFHWHLTEDQGWRIEIKKYPKLNEISGIEKKPW